MIRSGLRTDLESTGTGTAELVGAVTDFISFHPFFELSPAHPCICVPTPR
jgi:hypothetical protein